LLHLMAATFAKATPTGGSNYNTGLFLTNPAEKLDNLVQVKAEILRMLASERLCYDTVMRDALAAKVNAANSAPHTPADI